MKGVQCYELFGGIALKNHAFFFFHIQLSIGRYANMRCIINCNCRSNNGRSNSSVSSIGGSSSSNNSCSIRIYTVVSYCLTTNGQCCKKKIY